MISTAELEILRTDLPALTRNFRQLSPQQWQMSCDVCGDSKRDRRKARFGISVKDGSLIVHCFNCDYSGSFLNYLRYQHPDLAQRLNRERFVQSSPSTNSYDVNRIIKEIDSENLMTLFFITKFEKTEEWIQHLKKMNINVSDKEAFTKLYNVHRKVHNEQ